MKRILIVLITMVMTLGLTAAAQAAEPQRSRRTIHGSYRPYPSPVTGCNELLGSWACMIVHTQPTERFAAVRVTDAHGLPVYFSLFIPGTGFRGFCGETKTPISIVSGRDLEIEVGVSRWVAQTDCPANSIKTVGTIKVTLSNQR
jgi:hypothetical protein